MKLPWIIPPIAIIASLPFMISTELETRSLPADLEGVETDVPGLVFGGVNGILTVLQRCV